MTPERDVLDRLERAGVDYDITGSEALSVWGEPRQTMDIWGHSSDTLPSSAWHLSWSGSVAIDSASQAIVDERLRRASLAERRALHVRLRDNGIARVWAQVDRAAPMSELETARFVLRRLYPDLKGSRLEAIMARLAADFEVGTWMGLRRPPR